METVKDRCARLFADAAAAEAEFINAMLAEHSKSGRLRSGLTIQRAVAIVGETSSSALAAALDGIATRTDTRGRVWRRMVGEVEVELSAHLDAAPTRIQKTLQMLRDGERLAEPMFTAVRQDLNNQVAEFREGWKSPPGRGWHDRHPVIYAIILLALGAIIGKAAEKGIDYAIAGAASDVEATAVVPAR